MKPYILCLLPVLLIACTPALDGAATAAPAAAGPTAAATASPDSIATQIPTATQSPTATQPPTASPTASPTATPFILPVFTAFPPINRGTLVIDGVFDDWETYAPIYVDAAGDAGPSGVDFTGLYIAHTDTHILMKVDLGRTVNVQSEPALHLFIQLGGTEISYNFGKRIGRLNGESVTQSALGVISLPTVSSETFEISIPYEAAPGLSVKILFSDPEDSGDIASPDRTPIQYSWSNPVSGFRPLPLDPRPEAIRIVSWNVLRDNIFDRKLESHFESVLQALQPDVILLQEIFIYSENKALEHITGWLGGDWFAKKQGDLVTISRFPFVEDWRDSNYNLRSRIFPTMIDVHGTPVLIFNAHMSCCDRDQDRQDEADSFIGFLREAPILTGVPLILAGDLNLVGDARQLDTLLTGDIADESKFGMDHVPDWDGTALKDMIPRHSHSNFAHTWRDADMSFTPGRLDFIIYSDSVINAAGFVLDTSEMPEDVLQAYGLQAEDTELPSDHLPLVADIVLAGLP